jgi:uncharacterized protein Yka (UPF0111/DUF47 family)
MILNVEELAGLFGPRKPFPYAAIARPGNGQRDVRAMCRQLQAADERLTPINGQVLIILNNVLPAPAGRKELLEAISALQVVAVQGSNIADRMRQPGVLSPEASQDFTAWMARLMEAVQELHSQGMYALYDDFFTDLNQ